MLPLKCTEVIALSYPVHFNRSILKLNNIGTTVKRKRVRCWDFQNMFEQGLTLYPTWHSKNVKIYNNVGVATKAPRYLKLAQNGHFIENGWSDFYKIFRNVFFDLKQIHKRYITATKSIRYYVKSSIWPKLTLLRPPQTPLIGFSFLGGTVSFLADFNKKVSKCSVDHTSSYKLVP